MLLVLPIAFIPFVLNFPAGLMLYWLTTNLWTTGQGLDHAPARAEDAAAAEEELADTAEEPRSKPTAPTAPKPAAERSVAATPPRVREGEAEEGRRRGGERALDRDDRARRSARRSGPRCASSSGCGPGLDKSAVRFQVVTEGERGLLGVGYEPARVVATVDGEAARPASAEPAVAGTRATDAARLRELVERIAREIGVQCTIEIEETEDELRATCDGRRARDADRPPRPDDRRDPVPRERDPLPRPVRRAQAGRRRRSRLPRPPPGDARRAGAANGGAGVGDGRARSSSSR